VKCSVSIGSIGCGFVVRDRPIRRKYYVIHKTGSTLNENTGRDCRGRICGDSANRCVRDRQADACVNSVWSVARTRRRPRLYISVFAVVTQAGIPRRRHGHRHPREDRRRGMSACRSACHRNNLRKSRVSDVSARTLARMSVSVSTSWNASLSNDGED